MPGPTDPTAGAPRLLIVEDEFLVAMLAEDVLTEAGFEVAGIARSCEEALALCASHGPDLVLMDIRLATARDGVEAAIAIRETLGIASLFTSANHDPDTIRRAEPAAPVGWLPKPYTPSTLVAAVRQALDRLRALQHD